MNFALACFAIVTVALSRPTFSAPIGTPAVSVAATVPSGAPETTTLAPIVITSTTPAPSTTTPCGDSLTNCNQYISECSQPDYQATMYKFCRKTCGMCFQ